MEWPPLRSRYRALAKTQPAVTVMDAQDDSAMAHVGGDLFVVHGTCHDRHVAN